MHHAMGRQVPVDNVKQKMQAHLFHTIQDTCRGIWAADGARGFYVGTLAQGSRRIPNGADCGRFHFFPGGNEVL